MRQLGRLTPCWARVVVFIKLTPPSPHLSSIVSNFSSTLVYSLVETGHWKMVSILPINAKQQTNLSLSTNISNHNLVNQSQSYNMLSSVSVPWSILWNQFISLVDRGSLRVKCLPKSTTKWLALVHNPESRRPEPSKLQRLSLFQYEHIHIFWRWRGDKLSPQKLSQQVN